MKFLATALLLWALCTLCEGGMMGWLFAGDPAEPSPSVTAGGAAGGGNTDGARLVPFEVASSDDKFLASVKKLTSIELSDLDMCQHKVFLALQQSCTKLSEEDLAKVAVQLLNCQSQAEGRPVFPCTVDMTIAACTRHMDANTWNAYHIVSNRARAVCYAARQQQFRASTEMAVNRLAAHTFRQLEGMQALEGSQRELERMTGDTLQTVSQGQQQLLQQHGQMKHAQASIQSHVVDNLRELSRVRSAISVGQAGVSHTLEQIRVGLEQAADQLGRHEGASNRSHQQLAADLERLRTSAAHLMNRLESVDDTTRAVVSRFDALVGSLERMNGTIFTLLSTLETTQTQVDRKLGWLVQLLGSDLHRVTHVLLHAGYLLLAMLLLAFLSAPRSVRLGLLLLVPTNLLSLLRDGPALDFPAITTALITIGAVHHVGAWLWGCYGARPSPAPAAALPLRASSLKTEPSEEQLNGSAVPTADLSRASTHDVNSSDSEGEVDGGPANPRSEFGAGRLYAARAPLRREMGRASPLRQRLQPPMSEWDTVPVDPRLAGDGVRITTTRASPQMTERPWCTAVCRNGRQCRNACGPLSPYCGLHARGAREGTPLASG